jgi:hypothetical protein
MDAIPRPAGILAICPFDFERRWCMWHVTPIGVSKTPALELLPGLELARCHLYIRYLNRKWN